MLKSYFLTSSLMVGLLTSCLGTAPKKGEQTDIKNAKAALASLSIEVSRASELGLFLIGDPAIVIDIVATNNSSLPITGVDLSLSDIETAGMTFNPEPSGIRSYPGYGGDCGSTLGSLKSCTIKIYYNPLVQGVFKQKITLNYVNVLEPKYIDYSFSLQTGEPASLVFTSDKTTYSFGVVERKDCRSILSEDLTIKNAGGLPADNVIWSLENSPSASVEAFKISSNNCPTKLEVGALCSLTVSFQPQNWGNPQDCNGDGALDIAPDFDTYAVSYSSQLRADYDRDPIGGKASLNGYFSSLSTTIEGRISVSGLTGVVFDDPFFVAGQKIKKTIKLANSGYKEAILRSIHIRQGGVSVATCIKDLVGSVMECRSSADPNDSGNKLTRKELPFWLNDNSNCFDTYSSMSYARNPDGTLTIPDIIQVSGIAEDGTPGANCFIDINFEPSVQQIVDRDFADLNDLEFIVEYDSTWKNLLDPILTINGENILTDDSTFEITDALAKMPARIYFSKFSFEGTDIIATSNKVIQYKSSTFNEQARNDGSLLNTIYLELKGDSFTWETSGLDEVLSEGAKFQINNLPVGLSAEIKKINKDFGLGSTEHAEIKIIGSASSHDAANSITNLEIIFKDAAFSSSVKGEIFNSTKSNLSIKFIDSYKDFAPDPGDLELDIFIDLGRIALVNNAALIRSISFSLRNSGSESASITSVTDGKGQILSAGSYIDLTESDGTYYRSGGYDNNTVSSGASATSFVMLLNSKFLGDVVKQNTLFYDVQTGVDPIDKYKKFTIEYDDGADFNDDGTARRKQKINVHWTGVLVTKGFLVIEDTGGPSENLIAGNVNIFNLKLKNDGTGPVTFIKLRAGFDDLFDYNTQAPLSFIDDPSCNAPVCKDCFEIVYTSSTPWPGAGALDCAGADSSLCLNAGESCIMKVESRLSNANIVNSPYGSITLEKLRDYVLSNEVSDPEKNWEFDTQGLTVNRNISIEYLDGDHGGRTNENITDYGDINIIGGVGALSSGQYNYQVEYDRYASVVVSSPKPMDSAVIYRQAISLPGITSDSSLADITALTIPPHFLRFSTLENVAVRSFESIPHLASLVSPADDASYEWVFHGGSFPYDGATSYNMSFTLTGAGPTSAKNMVVNYTGPGNLTYSLGGTFDLSDFLGIITVNLVYTPSSAGESVIGELEFSYDNQLIELGSGVNITKKIKIIASSTASVSPTLSSQEQDSSLTPFGGVTNYDLKYNALSANSNYYKDVKGGGGLSHRYTLTNNSATESMKNIALYIKESVTTSSIDTSGIGHDLQEPTVLPCIGTTLGPGDSCEFDIKYTALDNDSGGPHERFLFINYAVADNQFITNQIKIEFEPADPALLTGLDWPTISSLSTRSVIGFFPDPYVYDYGDSTVSNCTPMESRSKTLLLRNSEVERASLLRAYRCHRCEGLGGSCKRDDEKCYTDPTTVTVLHDTAVFSSWHPVGDPVEVYSKPDGSMTVTAKRECLYGATANPPGEGFNGADGNICQIYVNWVFNKNQFGKNTIDKDNAFSLEIYSSELKRRSYDSVGFVFKAFVEPNSVTHSATSFSNVETDSSGIATFSFDEAVVNNADCGEIDGYRLFYSDTLSALDNIWTSSAISIDIPKTGASETVDISGLNSGSFYYYKIAAKRTFNGKQYLSESNLETLGLLVPPEGSFYDHTKSIVFDDYAIPKNAPPSQYLTPEDAISACASEEYELRKNGGNTYVNKVLVDEPMWDHILTDSDFTSYGGGDPWLFPHWLNEAPRFIGPYFPGYDCNAALANTADKEYAYTKDGDCSTNDDLPLLVGKNLLFLPYKYNFIEPNGSFFGYARCYAPVSP